MRVIVEYYLNSHDGVVVGFLLDLNKAMNEAHRARDDDGQAAVRRLFLDHFQGFLISKEPSALLKHLETLRHWKEQNGWRVFRTIDEPCLAFGAQRTEDGSIRLMAFGLCYRFPGGGVQAWWDTEIKTRVERLT